MRLGIITDEVSQDFEEALQFVKKHSLECVELRSAWEKGPFDYTEDDIYKIKALSDAFKIPVTAISSPVFKCEFSSENAKLHTEKFKKIVSFAKILGADKIRCFDFFKDENITKHMIKDAYSDILKICEKEGVTVVVESEPSTNSCSCQAVAQLVEYIGHPNLKALYDPGNNIYSTTEIPYPDGYEYLKKHLCHIHIKDAVIKDGKAYGARVGEGLVDYNSLFSRLKKDGYTGDVMLETHYRPEQALSDDTLKNPKGSAISQNGYEASELCIVSLKKIIEENQ